MDTSVNRASVEDMFVNSAGGNDAATYDVSVCVKEASAYGMRWQIKGAKLDSQSWSSSIGDNKSVDMSFSTQVGGPQDENNGMIIQKMTGACTDPQTDAEGNAAAVEAPEYSNYS